MDSMPLTSLKTLPIRKILTIIAMDPYLDPVNQTIRSPSVLPITIKKSKRFHGSVKYARRNPKSWFENHNALGFKEAPVTEERKGVQLLARPDEKSLDD